MPRRSGHDLSTHAATWFAALTAVVFFLGASSCQNGDAGTAGCEISQQVSVAGSPLTLAADAHLERLGASFALTAVDRTMALTAVDGATLRWASYDAVAGTLGAEQALALPPVAAGPWLTLSSQKTSGDTLLVAAALAAGDDAELHVFAVPTVASPTPTPDLGPALAVIPNALAKGATPMVAFGASRSGPHAVLAWIDPKAGAVTTLLLSAAGEPIGNPTVLDRGPAFACLAFAPGQSALTLVYHRYPDATTNVPHFLITELGDSGGVASTLELILDSHAAGCPQVTPTDAGYAIAFQDAEASWLGVYDDTTNQLAVNPFAAAVAFGGAALQPPLAGLAPMGADFGVVLDRLNGGELWRLSAQGGRRAGHLAMPSAAGTVGNISSQSDSGSLTATYADYTALTAGLGTAGQRYFLRMTCQ